MPVRRGTGGSGGESGKPCAIRRRAAGTRDACPQSVLCFAYDASVNGDWVSSYAIRLAAHAPDRRLQLLHVDEGKLGRAALDARLARIGHECALAGVAVEPHVVPVRHGVTATLLELVQPGPDSRLVCGTRARQRDFALLAGTVAAQLLRSAPFGVLAVRVVQPGLLGVPRRVLAPVEGHARGFAAGLGFLGLFAPDVDRLHVLLVASVERRRFRHMDHDAVERALGQGRGYVARVEREIAAALPRLASRMDGSVVVSDDVPKEIVIQANRHRSRLIYLGASERSLPARFLYGNPIEQVLREAPCDVAIYRGAP